MRERTLVLLSGGVDSAVALWWALAEGDDVVALSFQYPGRPRGESHAARSLAARAGLGSPLEVELPFMHEAADAPLAGPEWAAAPRGYVPARNAMFYAIALYHAELLGCSRVVGGHNAGDGDRFPDATETFFARYGETVARGLWRPDERPAPKLAMPLLRLTKSDVVHLGRKLGAPLDHAWSCYEDGDSPCGACPSCLESALAAQA